MWDTSLLILLSVKDFLFKNQQAQYGLRVKPKAVELAPPDTAVNGPLQLVPESASTSDTRTRALRYGTDITDAVMEAVGPKAHPRLKQIMPCLVRHLYDFCREKEITVREWEATVQFLNEVCQSSTQPRNEGELFCDYLDAETLIEDITCKLREEAANCHQR